MSLLSASSAALVLLTLLPAPVQKPGEARHPTAPETFRAHANATNKDGAAAATYVDIQIDKYTRDADRDKLTQALKSGGYPALLTAVRNAPAVGTVTIGKDTFTIRFAREQRTGGEHGGQRAGGGARDHVDPRRLPVGLVHPPQADEQRAHRARLEGAERGLAGQGQRDAELGHGQGLSPSGRNGSAAPHLDRTRLHRLASGRPWCPSWRRMRTRQVMPDSCGRW